MRLDEANLVAAIEWALGRGLHEQALEIWASGLYYPVALSSSYYPQASRWLDTALRTSREMDSRIAFDAYLAMAGMAGATLRSRLMVEYAELARDVAATLEDPELELG